MTPEKTDQFPDAGKMVDLESGELLKIAEQFRAMNPPWFKAISGAAIRIRELEGLWQREIEATIEAGSAINMMQSRIRELEAKLEEAEKEVARLKSNEELRNVGVQLQEHSTLARATAAEAQNGRLRATLECAAIAFGQLGYGEQAKACRAALQKEQGE